MKHPEAPWKTCGVSYEGPVEGPGGHYVHLLLDLETLWPKVMLTRSPRMAGMYLALTMAFCNHRVPDRILHDTGHPYNTQEWRDYVKRWGFVSEPSNSPQPPVRALMDHLIMTVRRAVAMDKDPTQEVAKALTLHPRKCLKELRESKRSRVSGNMQAQPTQGAN